MSNMNNTRPLYTEVETDWLDKLMQAKYSMDAISKGAISSDTISRICQATNKAKAKHPHFADIFTTKGIEDAHDDTKIAKAINDQAEAMGLSLVATEILHEEVCEAEEAFRIGDKQNTINELCDVAAVVLRMIEFVEEEMK